MMRSLRLSGAALAMLSVTHVVAAQTFTNCSRAGPSVNCTTMGDGGLSTTNCNHLGASVNCTTFGPPPAQPGQPVESNSGETGGGGGAVAAGALLGVLAIGGVSALVRSHQQKVKRDRAVRVATLISVHDCDGAVALATKENDLDMARQAEAMCKSAAQAGEEPAFVQASAVVPERVAWFKANVRPAPGAKVLGASPDHVFLSQPAPTPSASVWIREEATSEQGVKEIGGRSTLMLVAFDCGAVTFSIKASTHYVGQNLSGVATSDDRPTSFAAVRPGSNAVSWMGLACPSPAPSGALAAGH